MKKIIIIFFVALFVVLIPIKVKSAGVDMYYTDFEGIVDGTYREINSLKGFISASSSLIGTIFYKESADWPDSVLNVSDEAIVRDINTESYLLVPLVNKEVGFIEIKMSLDVLDGSSATLTGGRMILEDTSFTQERYDVFNLARTTTAGKSSIQKMWAKSNHPTAGQTYLYRLEYNFTSGTYTSYIDDVQLNTGNLSTWISSIIGDNTIHNDWTPHPEVYLSIRLQTQAETRRIKYIRSGEIWTSNSEEEEEEIISYPTYDYGTFNTAFKSANWSSTSTDITVGFQVDSSELSTIDRNFFIDSLSFCYFEISGTSSPSAYPCAIYPISPSIDWSETEIQEFSQWLDLPLISDGDYTAEISFYDIQEMSKSFQGITNIYIDFTVASGSPIVTHQSSISNNLVRPEARKYRLCNLSNLDGCILNALNFAFIPEYDYFTNWVTVWDSMGTSFPFQYLTEILNIVSSTTNSTTTSHSLGVIVKLGSSTSTISFLDTNRDIVNNSLLPEGMFNYIRRLLGFSVWFSLIVFIIIRIRSFYFRLI